MEGTKYIGMDVHKNSISIAVLNSSGKLVMESIIETKAITILGFMHGLRGSLHLTFEEGTWAAWLYDLLKIARSSRTVIGRATTRLFRNDADRNKQVVTLYP